MIRFRRLSPKLSPIPGGSTCHQQCRSGITGPLEEIPTEEIKNNFETNFFGPIEVMKAVLPQMRAQKSGLIINVTSIAGYMGLPYRSVYSASKGALELIAEALRMEVKSFGIQITNVAPGDFATNICFGAFSCTFNKGFGLSNSVWQYLEDDR